MRSSRAWAHLAGPIFSKYQIAIHHDCLQQRNKCWQLISTAINSCLTPFSQPICYPSPVIHTHTIFQFIISLSFSNQNAMSLSCRAGNCRLIWVEKGGAPIVFPAKPPGYGDLMDGSIGGVFTKTEIKTTSSFLYLVLPICHACLNQSALLGRIHLWILPA